MLGSALLVPVFPLGRTLLPALFSSSELLFISVFPKGFQLLWSPQMLFRHTVFGKIFYN